MAPHRQVSRSSPLALLALALVAMPAAGADAPTQTTTAPEPEAAPALADPTAARAAAPLGVAPTEPRIGPTAFRGAPPRFATPRGGTARAARIPGGLRLSLYRPDGSIYAQADGDSTGYRRLAYYDARSRLTFTAQSLIGGSGPAPRSESARCASAAATTPGPRVTGIVPWLFNARSVPRGLSVTTVQQHLRNAHIQWAANRNHCRLPDRSGLRFSFRGRTTVGVGLNGRSTFGFGDPAALGCTQARTLACTLTWFRNGTTIVEADVRLTTRPGSRGWATRKRAGFFDVWSVAAHEVGHAIGFGHATSGGQDNVMASSVFPGDVTNRLLGRGDATANNRVY